MQSSFMKLLVRWAVMALGVILATKLIRGITCADGWTLFDVVVLLTFFNAIVRPFLVLFTLPFILVTMGLGIVVINALLFLFVGHLVTGFHVGGFWSAVGGSIVVSLTSIVVNLLIGRRQPPAPPAAPPPGPGSGSGDVIDI